jgi:hypothetical protein
MRWLRVALVAIAILALPVVAYVGYSLWDIHRLERMCSKIQPGVTLAEARDIVTRAGLGQYFRKAEKASPPGVFDQRSGLWEIAIPAPTTIGDMVCFISHDGRTVKAAQVYGP